MASRASTLASAPLTLALVLTLLALAPYPAAGFDQRELQLFDLVEEMENANFYEKLGITREASGPEIRRAFRRVSMQYHPDRLNKHDEATVDYFRRLNAINEVLKDETLRRRYDEILDHGLPDWRSPVYYYRKWRKMSLAEVLLVLALLFSVGHYLVLWGVYFERRLELEDLFRRKRRKKQKQLEEEMEPLVGPTWRDALPLAMARGLYACVVGAPEALREVRAYLEERREAERERQRAAAEEAAAAEEEAQKRLLRKQQKRERREQQLAQLLLTEQANLPPPPSTMPSTAPQDAPAPALIEGPWSEEEQQVLVRAVARFPSGTPGRWEKIAKLLRRSVSDVTAKAREAEQQMRRQAAASFNAAFEVNTEGAAVCGESDEDSSDADSSDSGGGGRSTRRRRNRRQKQKQQKQRAGADKGDVGGGAAANGDQGDQEEDDEKGGKEGGGKNGQWTQEEQSLLEAALRQFPKGTRDRWDQVAAAVGSRGADECAQRCRAINERLRLKKD